MFTVMSEFARLVLAICPSFERPHLPLHKVNEIVGGNLTPLHHEVGESRSYRLVKMSLDSSLWKLMYLQGETQSRVLAIDLPIETGLNLLKERTENWRKLHRRASHGFVFDDGTKSGIYGLPYVLERLKEGDHFNLLQSRTRFPRGPSPR
jgi:hypothetical protein